MEKIEIQNLFNLRKICGLGIANQKIENLASIILNQKFKSLLLGAPGVTFKEPYRETVKVIHSFPLQIGTGTDYIYEIPERLLTIRNECWIQKHEIRYVDELNNRDLKDIVDFVNLKNSITFMLQNEDNGIEFLEEFHKFVRTFRYNLLFNYVNNGRIYLFEDEPLTTSITFLKMADCIPIFNSKKIEGVGVIVSILGERSSNEAKNKACSVEATFIVSNYKDNIFIVDGIQIRQNKGIGSEYFADAIATFEKKHERRKKEDVKSHEKKGEVKDEIITLNISDYNTSGSTYYSNTSTTTGYQYKF